MQSNDMVGYKIYPSLLDRFQRLLDTGEEFESLFNEDTENGGYKQSFEALYAKNEQDLLDAINRKPHDPIMAADRGTCFNEIVDCLIENRKSSREDVTIASRKAGAFYYKADGSQGYAAMAKGADEAAFAAQAKAFGACVVPAHIEAKMNGFTFRFDTTLCMDTAAYFAGSLTQLRCEAEITTQYGDVLLYGYADEVRRDVVYDIKTTAQYEFGKFKDHWQRYVYPYCLIEGGLLQEVSEFEYTPIVLNGGTSRTPLIGGTMYRERYDYNHEDAAVRIRQVLERFIPWLEEHREQITDKKIFGGTNDED